MEASGSNDPAAKRVLTISLPRRGREALVKAIEDLAVKNEYSLSEQIRVIIKDHLRSLGYEGIK